MRFQIRHRSHYQYSRPVFLEPHVFRLRPQAQAGQRLESYLLRIEPVPTGLTEYVDAEGNSVAQAWFTNLTGTLTITAESVVETYRVNPFDYLLETPTLPITYKALDQHRLAPCRGPVTPALQELSDNLAGQANRQTLAFLNALNGWIYTTHRVILREEGAPWPPEATLQRREGSCRDLVVLFLAACRAQGLAARFASGYQEGDPDQAHRHLHAWAEVYLPGGGWRGFDPTHGLAVSDRHVLLAAASQPSAAAPVSGTFRGTGASATLAADIQIRVG